MNLLVLVITVCSLTNPSLCQTINLQFFSDGSLGQCMLNAPPHIAQWVGDHPDWQAVRWHCANPAKLEKDV